MSAPDGQMPETNRIEYKSTLTREMDLEKEVVAFLNYREGGLIYIGVDKTGKALGISDPDGDMLKIKDRIKNNISPSAMGLFDVLSEERGESNIIKIIVASGSEKPYFKKKYGMTEKGCFIRVGTAAEPMPQQMIDKLFATRTRNSIGKIKAHRQDLSFEQLRIYYEEKKKPLNKQFKKNLELLTEEGFSIPRNKELMRVFNDLEMVVTLDSGATGFRHPAHPGALWEWNDRPPGRFLGQIPG